MNKETFTQKYLSGQDLQGHDAKINEIHDYIQRHGHNSDWQIDVLELIVVGLKAEKIKKQMALNTAVIGTLKKKLEADQVAYATMVHSSEPTWKEKNDLKIKIEEQKTKIEMVSNQKEGEQK